jgi:hypothetical protein
MKFNLKILVVLIFGVIVQFNGNIAQASLSTPEQIYNSLGGELNLTLMTRSGPILGTAVTQKSNPTGFPNFCRRTSAVVPNPVYSYQCFYKTLTGAAAQTAFYSSNVTEFWGIFRSVVNGGVLVGSSWSEKYIASDTLCVKTAPVVPNPVLTFTCYDTHGGIGGGVSGGN